MLTTEPSLAPHIYDAPPIYEAPLIYEAHSPAAAPRLKPAQAILLDLIRAAGPLLDQRALAERSGLSERSVRRNLAGLAELGLVQRTRRYYGWQLTPLGRGAPKSRGSDSPSLAESPTLALPIASALLPRSAQDAGAAGRAEDGGSPSSSPSRSGRGPGGRFAPRAVTPPSGDGDSTSVGDSTPPSETATPVVISNSQSVRSSGQNGPSNGQSVRSSGQNCASSGQIGRSSGQNGPFKEVVDSLTSKKDLTTPPLRPPENAGAPTTQSGPAAKLAAGLVQAGQSGRLSFDESPEPLQVDLILSAARALFGEPILRVPGKPFEPRLLLAWCAQVNCYRKRVRTPARIVYSRLRAGDPPEARFLAEPARYLPPSFLRAIGLPQPPPDDDDPLSDGWPNEDGECSGDDDLEAVDAASAGASAGACASAAEDGPAGAGAALAASAGRNGATAGDDRNPGPGDGAFAAPRLPVDPLITPASPTPGCPEHGMRAGAAWQEAVDHVTRLLPYHISRQYLEPLALLEYLPESGIFRVQAPAPLNPAFMQARYAPGLAKALTNACGRSLQVRFEG